MPVTYPDPRTLASADPRHFRAGQTVTASFDPSMTDTGYAVFRGDTLIGAGHIGTNPSEPEPVRLWQLTRDVLDILQQYQVHHVAIEEFQHIYTNKAKAQGSSARAAAADFLAGRGHPGGPPKGAGRHDRGSMDPKALFLMKAAQTTVQVAGMTAGCVVFTYPVRDWKRATFNNPSASKQHAVELGMRLYPSLSFKNDNIWEAILIGRHHFREGKFRPERGAHGIVEDYDQVRAGVGHSPALTPAGHPGGSLDPAVRPRSVAPDDDAANHQPDDSRPAGRPSSEPVSAPEAHVLSAPLGRPSRSPRASSAPPAARPARASRTPRARQS